MGTCFDTAVFTSTFSLLKRSHLNMALIYSPAQSRETVLFFAVQVHPPVRQQKSNNFTVAEVCSTVEWCAAPSVTGVHFQSPVS